MQNPPQPSSPKLSVVIPVYNERATLQQIVSRVQGVDIDKEIILVDDFSTDGTREVLKQLEGGNVRVLLHDRNLGKGAALHTAFAQASGQYVLVQDADLEYDPQDYFLLLAPFEKGVADVVFGSRFQGGMHRVLFFWHYVGNTFLTLLSNMFSNLNLSDVWTCYKVFRREVLQQITLEEKRFGFEPEVTAKIAKKGFRIYEVPISYYGRTYAEGKKITWRDGVAALWFVVKYNIFSS
jgi:glycosyltransferase involved in cell wall biosynthesis